MDYDKILELAEDNKVKLGLEFRKEIGKSLALGMTRYVCINGTLSDGHEKITDAQRYYQSVKEMYGLSNEITNQKINAMEAQADLMDAQIEFENAHAKNLDGGAARLLRAEAKILRAKSRLTNCLVSIEDSTRCLKAFNDVRLELKDKVEARYPEGIEQAEPDNWMAVAQYRALRQKSGHREMIQHVPLDPVTKAKLGMEADIPELVYWQALREQDVSKEKGLNVSLFKGELECQKPTG